MRRTGFVTIMAAALSASCSTAPRTAPAMPMLEAGVAQAEIRDGGNAVRARSSVSQVGDALRVRVESNGLPPGIYGAHLHGVGRCDRPTFETAGPHWNPSSRQHGRDNPNGQHLGDLPNLMVGTDGRGSFEFTVPGASLSGGAMALLDGDGAALVIHARPDDYRTDPSGNSGTRIACGVLG